MVLQLQQPACPGAASSVTDCAMMVVPLVAAAVTDRGSVRGTTAQEVTPRYNRKCEYYPTAETRPRPLQIQYINLACTHPCPVRGTDVGQG